MNKNKKLGSNILLLTIGNFASKLLTFFLVPFYTLVLTPVEYGISDLVITTVNLVSPVFTLLIGEAVMRYALDKEYDKKQIMTVGLLTVLAGFIFMMIFSPLILLSKTLKPYYILFVSYYLVSSLNYLFSQFTKGIEEVKLYTISGILNTFFVILFNLIFLLVMKIGIVGYLLSMILANILSNLVMFFGANMKQYLIKPKEINKKFLIEMYRYSIPLVPNSISWWISNSSDRYILTFFCGVTVTGIYSISYKIPTILSIVSTIFIGAWQISAVEDFGEERTRLFYSSIYRNYSSINIVLSTILIIITKPIARILFSKDFYTAWEFSPILIFAYMFYAMSGFLGTIYTSAKKTKMVFYSTMLAAISNIVLTILFIPYWGGTGAAIATLFSYFCIWLFRLVNSRKIMEIDINITKDCVCYILILIQVVLICVDKKIFLIFLIPITIIILALEFKFLREIYSKLVNYVKFKFREYRNLKN